MDNLFKFLDKFFETSEPQAIPVMIEDTDEIESLSPAEQAYKDYFFRKDLVNRRLNLIA